MCDTSWMATCKVVMDHSQERKWYSAAELHVCRHGVDANIA